MTDNLIFIQTLIQCILSLRLTVQNPPILVTWQRRYVFVLSHSFCLFIICYIIINVFKGHEGHWVRTLFTK